MCTPLMFPSVMFVQFFLVQRRFKLQSIYLDYGSYPHLVPASLWMKPINITVKKKKSIFFFFQDLFYILFYLSHIMKNVQPIKTPSEIFYLGSDLILFEETKLPKQNAWLLTDLSEREIA